MTIKTNKKMNMLFSGKITLAVITGTILVSACDNSPYPGYDTAESGLYYQFHKQNKEGKKPQVGDFVKLRMQYKETASDSVLFKSEMASRDGSGTFELPITESSFKGSFEEALLMMTEGDSASFIISADSFYMKTFKAKELPPFIKKGSMLTFDTKLEKIKSKDEVMKEQQKAMEEQQAMMEKRKSEEPAAIEKFIADNKITAKPTETGLYLIEKKKGTGAKIEKGDTVQVHYKGSFLDGQVFDSSENSPSPVEFPIGVGAVIPGWDEALTKMNVGGKAQLIIPSALAYGPMGSQGAIPPYSPLVFEVEVVGVKPVKK